MRHFIDMSCSKIQHTLQNNLCMRHLPLSVTSLGFASHFPSYFQDCLHGVTELIRACICES